MYLIVGLIIMFAAIIGYKELERIIFDSNNKAVVIGRELFVYAILLFFLWNFFYYVLFHQDPKKATVATALFVAAVWLKNKYLEIKNNERKI